MIMRIKAQESLKKLKKMKDKRRKYQTFSNVDEDTWIKCTVHGMFGPEYPKIIKWVNENTNGFHSRSQEAFWFEDEKDAFQFKLKWGEDNAKEES